MVSGACDLAQHLASESEHLNMVFRYIDIRTVASGDARRHHYSPILHLSPRFFILGLILSSTIAFIAGGIVRVTLKTKYDIGFGSNTETRKVFSEEHLPTGGMQYESLVHPALLTHSNPKRVAVAGKAADAILSEVLKHTTVEESFVLDEEDWAPKSATSTICPLAVGPREREFVSVEPFISHKADNNTRNTVRPRQSYATRSHSTQCNSNYTTATANIERSEFDVIIIDLDSIRYHTSIVENVFTRVTEDGVVR